MRPFDASVRAHLRPARRLLGAVVALGVAQAALVVVQAFLVSGAVVAMVHRASVGPWALAVAGVLAARAAATYVSDDAASRAAATVGATLRRRLLERLVLRPRAEDPGSTGSLVVLATRGVQETEPYLTRYLPALVLAAALPPVAVVAIASQDLLSAVIVLLTLPLVPLFAVLVGWRTRDRAASQWRQLSLLGGHFLDVVKGLPTLVVFRRAEHQARTIRSVTDRYRRATMATLRLAFASSAILELVATVSVALVAVTVGLRLGAGSLPLGTALTVLLLAPEAYWPVRRVGAEFHAAAQGAAAFSEVDRLLAGAETAPEPARCPVPSVDVPVSISLGGVTVTFDGQPAPALDIMSVDLVGPGLVTVTGPSGSGKSTLLATLQGRLVPTDGEVLVDGTPLAELDAEWWARRVSWTPQRPFFVHGALADNLRLGRPDASDDDLWSALRDVGLATLVSGLPDALATRLGEDGLTLSAGERARLALARVLVADRAVVLLDEPSAHLDPQTEQVVIAVLHRLARTCLVIVVAHSAAMVAAADHVVRLGSPVPSRPVLAAPSEWGDEAPMPDDAAATSVAAHDGGPVTSEPGTPPPRRARLLLAAAALLGALASAAGVALTGTAGWLIVKASTHPPVLLLMVAIVGVRTFGIARPVLRYAERLISHDAALRMLAEKRADVFSALMPLVPARLGRRRGDVLASVVDDVEAFVDRRLRVVLPLTTMLATGVLSTVVAAVLLPSVAVVLLALVVAVIAVFLVVRGSVRRHDRAWVQSRAALSDAVTEVVEGAAELRAWAAQDRYLAAVDRCSVSVERLAVRSSRRVAVGRAATLVAVGLTVATTLVLVASAAAHGRVTPAVGALLVLVPLAMSEVLAGGSDAAAAEVRTRAALNRLDGLLTQPPAVREPAHPMAWPPSPGDLSLTDVDAGWGARPVLTDLSLSLAPGSLVGVVGPSGSGKSTLAALLVRFLDPSGGVVRYAGTDLREASFDDVRRTVGLIDDDPYVFATTVAENVRLARPGCTDEQVGEALLAAGLGPWLQGLPAGLATWVGEGGRAVSGGERARFGLARIMLADPSVVVLDEPTAHLDTQTAERVMSSMLAGARGRTVLLITHRTEGLDRVDRVLALSQPARSSEAVDRVLLPTG